MSGRLVSLVLIGAVLGAPLVTSGSAQNCQWAGDNQVSSLATKGKLCLEIRENRRMPRSPLELRPCRAGSVAQQIMVGSLNQLFVAGSDRISLSPEGGNGDLCIGRGPGGKAELMDCAKTPALTSCFDCDPDTDVQSTIFRLGKGACLAATGGAAAPQVGFVKCEPTERQRWRLTPIEGRQSCI
jgi:hypothetical protein